MTGQNDMGSGGRQPGWDAAGGHPLFPAAPSAGGGGADWPEEVMDDLAVEHHHQAPDHGALHGGVVQPRLIPQQPAHVEHGAEGGQSTGEGDVGYHYQDHGQEQHFQAAEHEGSRQGGADMVAERVDYHQESHPGVVGDDYDEVIPEKPGMALPVKIGFVVAALFVVGIFGISLYGSIAKNSGANSGGTEISRPTEEPVQRPVQKIVADPMTELANKPVGQRVAGRTGDDQSAARSEAPQQATQQQGGGPGQVAGGPQQGMGDHWQKYGADGGTVLAGPDQYVVPGAGNPNPGAAGPLADDIKALKDSVANVQSGMDAKSGMLEGILGTLTARIAALESDVQALKSPPVEKKAAAVPPGRRGKSAKVASAEGAGHSRKHHHPEGRKKVAGGAAGGRCILKGGSDGLFEADKKPRAWIATEDGDMATKSVGEAAPCVGVIRSIVADGDDWAVVGDKGSLRLHTGPAGQ